MARARHSGTLKLQQACHPSRPQQQQPPEESRQLSSVGLVFLIQTPVMLHRSRPTMAAVRLNTYKAGHHVFCCICCWCCQVRDNKTALANYETQDMGKPIDEAEWDMVSAAALQSSGVNTAVDMHLSPSCK
jgi:hypothetical protein